MTGTLASILRAPALDWPDELAREATQGRRAGGAPSPEAAMTDSVTTARRERATQGRAA